MVGWEEQMLARDAAGRLQDAGAWRIKWAMRERYDVGFRVLQDFDRAFL